MIRHAPPWTSWAAQTGSHEFKEAKTALGQGTGFGAVRKARIAVRTALRTDWPTIRKNLIYWWAILGSNQ